MFGWRITIKPYVIASLTTLFASGNFIAGDVTTTEELEDAFVTMLLPARERTGNMTDVKRRLTLRQDVSSILGNFDLSAIKDEVIKGLTSGLTCKGCFLGLGIVKLALALGTSEEDIARKLIEFCVQLKIQPEKVCKGFIGSFEDEAFFILKRTPLSAGEICAAVVGSGCGFLTRRQKWVVPLSSKPKPPITPTPVPRTNVVDTSTILHISDTHVDFFYTEGSSADCADPLCCRNDSIAAGTKRLAGKWGDFGKCDVPRRTMEDMFRFIKHNHKIDYIFWTGDIPPHDVWKQTREEQLRYIQQTMNMIRSFFPQTLVLPVMGNHESAPPNSFPPSSQVVPEKFSVSWLYDALLNNWKNWLPESTYSTILKGGYYTIQINPGLRVISVNTNFCYILNWWLLLNFMDPGDQLRWLANNLQDAEDKGDKVYIIGHIPPGSSDCGKVWSANFYNIVNRYESTVSAQFYGHTHTDEFEVFYDQNNKKRATNVAYIGPSVTTYEALNPAYRLYTVDKEETQDVLDHTTYMMDIDDANKAGQPTWRKLYSAKEAYSLQSLRPQEWSNLVYRMRSNSSLFDQFYRYYHRDNPHYSSCGQVCRKDMICSLNSGKSHDSKLCSN